jgi:hypothetical protein
LKLEAKSKNQFSCTGAGGRAACRRRTCFMCPAIAILALPSCGYKGQKVLLQEPAFYKYIV